LARVEGPGARGLGQDLVEVIDAPKIPIKTPSLPAKAFLFDATGELAELPKAVLYLLAFALRASAITCSNSAIVSTPGTRNLPTMKDGVPRNPKAVA